jgi:hypothetical protein
MPGTLPTQHANSLSAPWSIAADNQFRSTLETSLDAALGAGVVAGGGVTKTAAFAVEVAAGTQVFTEGVLVELLAALPRTGITPSQTNYLWGLVTRTARTRATPTSVDSWSLALTHNTTGIAPSALSVPLAVIVADGAGITSIEEYPAGKFLRVANLSGGVRDTIALGEAGVVEAGHQLSLVDTLTVRGLQVVRGRIFVRGVS